MSSRIPSSLYVASPIAHMALPVVCLVTADEEFHQDLIPELLPWFQVIIRDNYEGLARWTRQTRAVAVLIDIDSDGVEPHAGLAVLDELRRLNEDFVLISISRSR